MSCILLFSQACTPVCWCHGAVHSDSESVHYQSEYTADRVQLNVSVLLLFVLCFSHIPVPVVVNSGATELASILFLSSPTPSLSFSLSHAIPLHFSFSLSPWLTHFLSPPEERSLTISLWGLLAARAEPLRCQAGNACCQIHPCWLTSPSLPRMPLPGSRELLTHFSAFPPAHWHQRHANAASPSYCCHAVGASHWHRVGIFRAGQLCLVCNIPESLQSPPWGHFQPVVSENWHQGYLSESTFQSLQCHPSNIVPRCCN